MNNLGSENVTKKNKNTSYITAIGLGQTVHVQRCGEATSQIVQAYTGKVYDSAGNEILTKKRSLDAISKYKINPEYEENNYKQQAGFSAEQIEEARRNKEAIKSGSTTRTRTSDDIGKFNDRVNDLVTVDSNGNIISGSGTQVKFYGIDEKGRYKVVDNLANNENWDRYESVLIPKDQYEGALEYADKMIEEHQKNADVLMHRGKIEQANIEKHKAERYQKAKSRLKQSKVTSDEAIQARKNPKEFVAKEAAEDCISAGLQSMKYAALIGGVVAIAQNTVAVLNDEKDLGDAALDAVNTTADSAFSGFFVGTAATALKACMHVSKNELIRRLGTTSAPTAIITGMIDVTKSITSFACGEIDSLELFEQLGEKGVCSIASGIGAGIGGSIGIIAGPAGTIVGGIAGGMVSYAVSSAIYNSAVSIINEARYARERRFEIEMLCNQAIESMHLYCDILDRYSKQRTKEIQLSFDMFFANIDKCAGFSSIDDAFKEFNSLDNAFGFLTRFKTFKEFDDFMLDKNSVLIL